MTQTMRPTVQDAYVSAFREFSGNGKSGAPAWLHEVRNQAIEQFATDGFPSGREERWRFTNVSRLKESPFALATDHDVTDVARAGLGRSLFAAEAAARLVFVNGWYSAELSQVDSLPKGVVVGSLADGLDCCGELLEKHLAKYARPSDNPFTALSTAFIAEAGVVYVPRGVVVDQPVHLLFVSVPNDEKRVSHPRTLVVVDESAAVNVVEEYVSAANGIYWTNPVTEAVIEANGSLTAYRLQLENDECFHTATTQSYQARDSRYFLATVTTGGALTRHDINAVLDGEGAESRLYGLTHLRGRQHVDHHTTIDHARPHGNSWEYFNGIYEERSRGVFTGRIIVRPGAQRTDSKQTNNNLLLSQQARADSQPQLEIYADDVKCTHGATLGPIDEKAMFYLRSRGLEEEEARSLLSYGFAVEILNQIDIAGLRKRLDILIHQRLAEGSIRRRSAA